MNRWVGLVALVALAGGVAVMSALRPDSGPPATPDPKAAAGALEPAAAVRSGAPSPRATGDSELPPVPSPRRAESGAGFVARQPAPIPPVDPDHVFPADPEGISSAVVARRPQMLSCLEAYERRTGEPGYHGRFTIEVSLAPGEARADTEVVNGPDDEALRSCVGATLADLNFAAPSHKVSMRLPVPVSPTSW
jgi:hypothetical protein